jgi:hypothetical protein
MEENKRIAVLIIRKYLRDLERRNAYYWNSAEFTQVCYSKIAANDLIELIESDNNLSAETIIENFRNKMDRYALMNGFSSLKFSIQHDTATYILDKLIDYKERRINQNGQQKTKHVH